MSTFSTPHVRLHDDLIRILQTDPDLPETVTDATPLIRSGLIDSQRLLDIALFVEREIGYPIDIATVDLASQWNTVGDILHFIEERRLPN